MEHKAYENAKKIESELSTLRSLRKTLNSGCEIVGFNGLRMGFNSSSPIYVSVIYAIDKEIERLEKEFREC